MYRLELPDARPADVLPFRDTAGAAAWLAEQPQAEPMQMQVVLQKAIAAADASDLPPATRLDILDLLRGPVILAQSALEGRYLRKPLPLPGADAEIFSSSRQLWRTLAVAYLRTVPSLSPREALRPLHRGAVALRLEQYAHFLAACEVPASLLHQLYGVLTTARALALAQVPLVDPEYRHMGESHIAGHVAWAFLLQFIDPYRLTPAELTVTNRAFSRWRELASFLAQPDEDPGARVLPLAAILGALDLGDDDPRCLNIRLVARKLRTRIEALEAGEAPEALKLGRELSTTACIRLLRRLTEALRPGSTPETRGTGELALAFGAENIYALLTGERLNPTPPGAAKPVVNHQRIAVFGFDNRVTPVDAAARPAVDREIWQACPDGVERAAAAGGRLQSPCLVAWEAVAGQPARLGMLAGLQSALSGRLRARLLWYPPPVQAASASLPAAGGGKPIRMPVFVLGGRDGLSLILPASAVVRPNSRLVLEGETAAPVILGQVLERGSDFVRYAAEPQQ